MAPPEREKDTISRQLAARLRFAFLDTGGMYRAVARAALAVAWDRATAKRSPAWRMN